MSASINSLFDDVKRDETDICAVRCVSIHTYSIAPPAQQVVGHGVLWLQLNGFIQMILGGKEDREGEIIFTATS